LLDRDDKNPRVAYACGRDGDTEIADLDRVGEEAEREVDVAEDRRLGRERVVQEIVERLEVGFLLARVDADSAVDGAAPDGHPA
jgi:hypothetical protein